MEQNEKEDTELKVIVRLIMALSVILALFGSVFIVFDIIYPLQDQYHFCEDIIQGNATFSFQKMQVLCNDQPLIKQEVGYIIKPRLKI